MRKKSYKKSAKSNAARIKKQAAKTLSQISKRKAKSTQATSGLESADITFYSQHRDELRKLIKVNNQRISRLAKKGLLEKSQAYRAIHPIFLTEDGKLRGSLKGLSYEHTRMLIEAHLKFATSATTTAKGISKVRTAKQNNLIEQMINYSDISSEDRKTLEKYLKSLSADEFDEVVDSYSYLLSKQFSYSSDQRFLMISQDIVQKARMMHEADTNQIMQQVKSNIMRADAKKREELKEINIDMLTDEELEQLSQETQDAIDAVRESPLERAKKRIKRKATFTEQDLKNLFS